MGDRPSRSARVGISWIKLAEADDLTPTDELHGQTLPALGRRGRAVHGGTRHYHRQHGGAGDRRGPAGAALEPEGRGDQLHPEPGGVHSGERLDGGPLRHAPRLQCRGRGLHAFLDSVRLRTERADAGCGAHPAGCRRGDDDAGGAARDHPHLPQIRTPAGDELRHHPGADRAPARPHRRRPPCIG